MAFKIFAGGATLSAADLNDYLMEQAVVVCTSSTRPSSPAEGWTIYETDTDSYSCYNGSAWKTLVIPGQWTAFTPTVYQDGGKISSVSITNNYCRYMRTGRHITYQGYVAISSGAAAIAGTAIDITLPLTAAYTAASAMNIGTGYVYDASAGTNYPGIGILMAPGVGFRFLPAHVTSSNYLGAVEFSAALAASDAIVWDLTYECASSA